MRLARFSGSLLLSVFVACSGGGSTGPSGNNGGLGGGGGGGGGGGSSECPANTVCMLASAFSPVPVTVTRGATVTFQNTSGIGHTVLFDAPRSPGVNDIGLHSSGTNTRDFTQAGRFPFHCDQHGGMTGEIVVN